MTVAKYSEEKICTIINRFCNSERIAITYNKVKLQRNNQEYKPINVDQRSHVRIKKESSNKQEQYIHKHQCSLSDYHSHINMKSYMPGN